MTETDPARPPAAEPAGEAAGELPEEPVAEPKAPKPRLTDHIHPGVLYTLARLAVFVVICALLYAVGFRSWIMVLGAAVLSAPVSFFLLRGQRDAYARRIEGRMSKRRVEKDRLRAALAGEDDEL